MRRINNAVLAALGALVCAAVAALAVNGLPWLGVFALPLALYLPGMALVNLLFDEQSPVGRGPVDIAQQELNSLVGARHAVPLQSENYQHALERVLLSVGLSVAITILGGLLLNLTVWGLQAVTWLVWLAGVTCAASLAAMFMRREPLWVAWNLPAFTFKPASLVLYGLAGLVLAGALYLALLPAPSDRVTGYTALWALPASQENEKQYRLGLTSQEVATKRFRLQVQAEGQVQHEWSEIVLEPGQAWNDTFDATQLPANAGAVEAVLYRLDAPDTVYRHVELQP